MVLTQPVKALLHKDQLRWDSQLQNPTTGGEIGTGVDIGFRLTATRPPGLNNDQYRNFTAFSNDQVDRINDARNNFSNVANPGKTHLNGLDKLLVVGGKFSRLLNLMPTKP